MCNVELCLFRRSGLYLTCETHVLRSSDFTTMSRDDLIQRMLTAFHKGDNSFGMEDVEAWLKVHSRKKSKERKPPPLKHSRVQLVPPSRQEMDLWEQGRYSSADPAEDEPAETTLWAALENSRKVVEEERVSLLAQFVQHPSPIVFACVSSHRHMRSLTLV